MEPLINATPDVGIQANNYIGLSCVGHRYIELFLNSSASSPMGGATQGTWRQVGVVVFSLGIVLLLFFVVGWSDDGWSS